MPTSDKYGRYFVDLGADLSSYKRKIEKLQKEVEKLKKELWEYKKKESIK